MRQMRFHHKFRGSISMDSQRYELNFWREQWPYRDKPIAELQELRHCDAAWFLGVMGFERISCATSTASAGRSLRLAAVLSDFLSSSKESRSPQSTH